MFFKKKKINFKKLYPKLNLKDNLFVENVKPLLLAKKNDLTFFDSIKYKLEAKSTKSTICVTTEKLKSFLPNEVNKIVVKNVLFELAKILNLIYVNADADYPDETLKKPKKLQYKNVKFGNNVLIGKKC